MCSLPDETRLMPSYFKNRKNRRSSAQFCSIRHELSLSKHKASVGRWGTEKEEGKMKKGEKETYKSFRKKKKEEEEKKMCKK